MQRRRSERIRDFWSLESRNCEEWDRAGTVITRFVEGRDETRSRHRWARAIFHSIRELSLTDLILKRKLFSAHNDEAAPAPQIFGERQTRRLLWYLLGGTRGGPNRVEILKALRDRPSNANQLASTARLDYKTIEHHIRVLQENGLVTTSEKGAYGAVLFLTPRMEEAWPLLEEIWARIGRTKISTADRRD